MASEDDEEPSLLQTMASEDDEKPGDSLSFPAPAHPPYAVMIAVAIHSLHEEGGSSESSISSYIQANNVGLPIPHDTLLRFCLNAFTASGLFVVSEQGRYSLTPLGDILSAGPFDSYQRGSNRSTATTSVTSETGQDS